MSGRAGGVAVGTMPGRIDGGSGGTVLFAFDDRISSAAPVADDGTFNALLPPPDADGSRGKLTLLYLRDGKLRSLAVVPATS